MAFENGFKNHKLSLCLLFLLFFTFLVSLISFSILVPLSNTQIQSSDAPLDVNIETSPQVTCPKLRRDYQVFSIPIEDCHPDRKVTKDRCAARGCCWNDNATNLDHDPWEDIDPKKEVPKNVTDPFCFFPPMYQGYKQVGRVIKSDNKLTLRLKRSKVSSGFRREVQNLDVILDFIDESKFRLRILDADQDRWMVPEPVLNLTKNPSELISPDLAKSFPPILTPYYDVFIENEGLTSASILVVQRIIPKRRTLSKINLNTLIYSDQFIQLSVSHLPSRYLSGLGEHYFKFRKEITYSRLTFKNSDRGKPDFGGPGKPGYGSQPFYLMTEDGSTFQKPRKSGEIIPGIDPTEFEDYSSHGVLFHTSNMMDVILTPNQITFRPIGGIVDMIFYLGPKASDVISQHLAVIGRPHIPPFWSLGFGLSKYGYKNLEEAEMLIKRNLNATIPLDVVWHDIDILDQYRDFTFDKNNFKGLPNWIREIRSNLNLKYVPIFDPTIEGSSQDNYLPFIEGNEFNMWIKNQENEVFVGKVWNVNTSYFPDFSNPNATEWWSRQFKRYYDLMPFDGAWIDMNEPSNFFNGPKDGSCPMDDPLESPEYVPGDGLWWEVLQMKTLCLSSRQYVSSHYNLHNMYGFHEAKATWNALRALFPGKRPFVLSRATTTGQAIYGWHWTGDVWSSYESMELSIGQIFDFNMFGFSLVGADICGFIGNTTADLCARWSSLGAFYPFSRNHNINEAFDQDPAVWGEDSPVLSSALKNLRMRYQLLPYLYTLFYEYSAHGSMVFKPMSMEFPTDFPNAYLGNHAERQFLWGDSLLFVPIVEKDARATQAYFPHSRWYQFYSFDSKSKYALAVDGGRLFQNVALAQDEIGIYVRGGKIVPMFAKHAQNTVELRKKPLTILVALDANGNASGSLYWDDGETFDTIKIGAYSLVVFNVEDKKFSSRTKFNAYEPRDTHEFKVNELNVLGIENVKKIKYIEINGKRMSTSDWKTSDDYLNVTLSSLDLNSNIDIEWFF